MPDVADTNSSGITVHRMFVWQSASDGYVGSGSAVAPTLGGDVDGVCIDGYRAAGDIGASSDGHALHAAIPGVRVAVEAGGAFSSGASLATDATGRAIVAGSGQKIVARALGNAAGAGSIVPIVFTSGR